MKETVPPSLLYVSTLDHIVRVMLPHLDAARARGWRVEIACHITRFGDDATAHSNRVHDLPFQRFPLHPKNLVALFRLTRLIQRNKYTIVHTHNPTGGFVGRLAATLARTGALRVYTAHGFHFHRHGGRVSNFLYRAIETFAGRFLSDAVLTINREDYEAALTYKIVPEDRLFLTGGVGVSSQTDFNPAAVTTEEREAIRQEAGVEESTPLLTVIGEMIPRKRHADALETFACLLRSHPNAILLLVGDGVLMEELREKAASLGISKSVRFWGFRRDVRQILAATDIFLFASQQEGLPCSVQEALSMSVPVVATNVRGNSDLVDDSCGRLAPFGDTNQLAKCASELITLGPTVRHRMGEVGRDKMLRLYDRPLCVAQWLEIYDQLLNRRQRGE